MWQTRLYSSATDNFKMNKPAWKSAQHLHRIHENGAQNLQVTYAEFSFFLAQNSDNPSVKALKAIALKARLTFLQILCISGTGKMREKSGILCHLEAVNVHMYVCELSVAAGADRETASWHCRWRYRRSTFPCVRERGPCSPAGDRPQSGTPHC